MYPIILIHAQGRERQYREEQGEGAGEGKSQGERDDHER